MKNLSNKIELNLLVQQVVNLGCSLLVVERMVYIFDKGGPWRGLSFCLLKIMFVIVTKVRFFIKLVIFSSLFIFIVIFLVSDFFCLK